MGSEHSNHLSNYASQRKSAFRREHSFSNPVASVQLENDQHNSTINHSEDGGRSTSPGPSVCSDTDLPYISYTVNRPIGDSPKFANKQLITNKSTNSKRLQTLKQTKCKNTHNIVVVRGIEMDSGASNMDNDPDVIKLQSIPMFLPIMRATISLPAARDPEILECLNQLPFRNLCLRYQHHLNVSANLVSNEQNELSQKIRKIDSDVLKLIGVGTEKQKIMTKYAEKLSSVQEISIQLNRCHMLLNETLELVETVNNLLDIEDRLEPFIWTTG